MQTEEQRIGQPVRFLNYCPAGTRQKVLGFLSQREDGGGQCLTQPIYQAFLPLGLYVHGATDETFLCRIRCGNQDQVDWTAPVSARFFQTDKSFAELARLAEFGEIEPLPRQLFEMDVLECGNQMSIETQGPLTSITVWGLQYRRGVSFREGLVVEKEGDHYIGARTQQTLRGEEVRLWVTAPSEDGVVRLLESRQDTKSFF